MSEGSAKKGFGEKPQPKEERRKFQAIKGTRDLLPPETALWNRVEQTAREVFSTFGYGEIRLPAFEATELFARSIGLETDVVSKEMYSFTDNPDLTDLEDLRDDIFRAYENYLKTEISELFLYSVQYFIRQVETALKDNRLTLNRHLQEELDTLKDRFTKFDALQASTDQESELNRKLLRKEIRIRVDRLKFGEPVTLRPEATASTCRAYIEHNMQQLPQPVKLYTIGPMFRRERPQKGRYRQFYQINAEILGGPDAPGIDAEVIEMVMMFFERLELRGVELDINSIGDRNCRPKYVELLRAELLKVKDKLGADSQRRIETNPLRVLDSKLEHEQPIIEKLPRIGEHLCKECAEHYAAVKKELGLRGVKYRENWRLVRGLDYYMRTTFEITAKGLGSQNAVCGGGRYDGLVELLGGPPTKGIGFAIGEDRLILSLQESGKAPMAQGRDVYIAWMGENARETAIRAANNLRSAGFSVELPPVEQKFGKALGQADKLGAKYALILGDNEVVSGEWTLKTLATSEQAKFNEPRLLEFLRAQRPVSR